MKKNVVIVGGGFAGLNAAKLLEEDKFNILLLDRTNHHLFQPLLYQVATSALSPADIAVPIRAVFKRKKIEVIMEHVTSVNKEEKTISTSIGKIAYDYLILAPGAKHSYFGRPDWEKYAPGLKTLADALTLREKILCSLESAEKLSDPYQQQKYLNFVIVGGGPTGVELAGAISEIVNRTIIKDYRNISNEQTRVYLIEAMDKILLPYPDDLSQNAKETLEKMGVDVLLKTMVTDVTDEGVHMGDKFIPSTIVIWAAGNMASPLLKTIDTPADNSGRIQVDQDLTVPGYPELFVIGDAAAVKSENGEFYPAVAPVAVQQGKYVAEILNKQTPAAERKPFRYKDRGMMATIGRAKAVAVIKGLKLTGFLAWSAWSVIHVLFLIGYRNRFRVILEWFWYYVTFRHGIRLIIDKRDTEKRV
jgi:NADH:ubiquinone reductase (H+-translocating)